jgi:3-hydroxyisobutyrate dehydrogenase-like beta-hydroxyacid dehydrogenase
MKLAFIGFGEAGSAIVQGWGTALPGSIAAYDIKSGDPASAAEIAARGDRLGVDIRPDSGAATEGADIVFCTVTADQALTAAEVAVAEGLGQGTIWLDCNSCSPGTKRRAAEVIEAAGARYVDVAVMAPVHPKLNLVPLLIAGPHAAQVAPLLQALPMEPRVVEGAVGAASAIKMIRSVFVKGLEAITVEALNAASVAGCFDEILGSLSKSYPGLDLPTLAEYNFERTLTHGPRRAAEMIESGATLDELGLIGDLPRAIAAVQAGQGAVGPDALQAGDLAEIVAQVAKARRG